MCIRIEFESIGQEFFMYRRRTNVQQLTYNIDLSCS